MPIPVTSGTHRIAQPALRPGGLRLGGGTARLVLADCDSSCVLTLGVNFGRGVMRFVEVSAEVLRKWVAEDDVGD